jgi:hypothetical protein
MKNLPAFKVQVVDTYLTNEIYLLGPPPEQTQAYLVAVKSEFNEALKFTVFLETGALWSGLTIDALRCDRFGIEPTGKIYNLKQLQPYSCLSQDINVIQYSFMKNYSGEFKIGSEQVSGAYMFTVDTSGPGTLADDAEQYKTFNVVQLNNGQLAALPNNYCTWYDEYFVDPEKTHKRLKYRRTSKYPLPGG